MNYVIGDVHGNYDTLLALVKKLPSDAKLIFVGDLIDRGDKSAEVIRFVRENGCQSVMGNHEELTFTFGYLVVSSYENATPLALHNFWYSNGGIETLLSYGLIELADGKPQKVKDYENALQRFKDDIRWMETLPLYIELEGKYIAEKPVVVSHAPIDSVWDLRNVESMYDTFHKTATTNRKNPSKDAKIFNIFGHTPVEFGPEVEENYVNVDTGCYVHKHGYGQLSAYCVENGEIIRVHRI
ncbi:metallophosphoesterase [bacterium]|nr:metallophosphoesterase [bacterium]MBU1884916.1 metallophosphoesterase [bacterium]